MVRAWRIVPQKHADTAFDGEGARLYGGRWNSPGRPAVYLAGSRALAALEVLVHLNQTMPRMRYVMFEVSIPDNMIESVQLKPLIPTLASPTILPSTQEAGDVWLKEGRSPALRIASAVIPQESNFLLNPLHPKFSRIQIGSPQAFAFDPRLL